MKRSQPYLSQQYPLFSWPAFRLVVLTFLLLIIRLIGFSQRNSFQYEGITKKVLNGELTPTDFKTATVFLTLDTINGGDLFAASNFVETNDPDEIICSFNNFMTSFKHDNRLFYYGESLESIFHDCRNILYGVFNAGNDSYVVNLWMDKDHPALIEGITVSKRLYTSDPDGYMVYFRP